MKISLGIRGADGIMASITNREAQAERRNLLAPLVMILNAAGLGVFVCLALYGKDLPLFGAVKFLGFSSEFMIALRLFGMALLLAAFNFNFWTGRSFGVTAALMIAYIVAFGAIDWFCLVESNPNASAGAAVSAILRILAAILIAWVWIEDHLAKHFSSDLDASYSQQT